MAKLRSLVHRLVAWPSRFLTALVQLTALLDTTQNRRPAFRAESRTSLRASGGTIHAVRRRLTPTITLVSSTFLARTARSSPLLAFQALWRFAHFRIFCHPKLPPGVTICRPSRPLTAHRRQLRGVAAHCARGPASTSRSVASTSPTRRPSASRPTRDRTLCGARETRRCPWCSTDRAHARRRPARRRLRASRTAWARSASRLFP